MISFIVIGRNQRESIARCLDSISQATGAGGRPSHEVIYVDSKSTDGTLEQVRSQYPSVRRVAITGQTNAGIARNAGAAVAIGDVLFFVDGDVEVDPEFISAALDGDGRLVHPVVTGQLPERLYDRDGRVLGSGPDCYRIHKRELSGELGGIFLIEKKVFEALHGFRPELRVNEDVDLGLRLAEQGVPVLRLPTPMGTHHTVEYFEYGRLFRMVLDGSWFFAGVTFRRHMGNRWYWPILASHQRPTAVLVVALVLSAFSPWWLGLYLAYIFAKNLRRPSVSYIQDLVGTAVRSLCFLVGVFFFRPATIPNSAIRYEIVG